MPVKKSAIVALGVTGVVAAAGWAAYAANDEEEPPSQAGICVDQDTQQRLDDAECPDESGHSNYVGGYGHAHPGWYFIPFGVSAPRVGARATGGSFNAPSGTSYVTGGVSRGGGTVDSSHVSGGKVTSVTRGGFGGTGHGSSS